MKIIIIFFTLFIWINSKAQQHLIAFYNLENFFDTLNDSMVLDEEFLPTGSRHYNTEIYTQKLNNMISVLNSLGWEQEKRHPVIIGLAEFENQHILIDIIQKLNQQGSRYKYAHLNSHDARGIDVGIIYDSHHFKPYEYYLLKHLDSPVKFYLNREIFYINGKLDSEFIHLFVCHFPSRRGGANVSNNSRKLAATIVWQKCLKIWKKEKYANIIVMGDMNDNPNDLSMVKGLHSVGEYHKVELQSLFNPFSEIFKQGKGTLAHNDEWALFDQILVSGNFMNQKKSGWHWIKANIFKDDFMIEKYGRYKGYPKRTWNNIFFQNGFSDHFPTYIKLEWQPGK